MVKFGIIADTHITSKDEILKNRNLIHQLKKAFKDVDEIIHVGDVCISSFLYELEKIAPTKCVHGEEDKIDNLPDFIKFSVSKYNIGVIHEPPKDIEALFK
ncbi:MAG: metallophosphoesterase family protein, partial [Promethearchaeota archaeon]